MMLADLHIHTTCSDGMYTPEEIVERAVAAKLSAIALTDHDNTAAFAPALTYLQAKHYPLELIQGVEIDTLYNTHPVHILGYHFDATNKALQEKLKWTEEGRSKRMEKMVAKVNAAGFTLTLDEVQKEAKSTNALGRPHLARALVRKGFFSTVEEVFQTLIASNKPCYVEQEKLSPKEAVALLHAAGGIASLAHPVEVGDAAVVEELLTNVPFDALEVWHPTAAAQHKWQDFLHLAKEHNLLTSGGSDFHGDVQRYPHELGIFLVNYADVQSVINY